MILFQEILSPLFPPKNWKKILGALKNRLSKDSGKYALENQIYKRMLNNEKIREELKNV